jgi:hypothetical protein
MQRRIGHLSVNVVFNWSRGRKVRILQLMVNESAIRFCKRLGFTRTG